MGRICLMGKNMGIFLKTLPCQKPFYLLHNHAKRSLFKKKCPTPRTLHPDLLMDCTEGRPYHQAETGMLPVPTTAESQHTAFHDIRSRPAWARSNLSNPVTPTRTRRPVVSRRGADTTPRPALGSDGRPSLAAWTK